MKLFLHSVYREANPAFNSGFFDVVAELARRDRFGKHAVADDPEQADVIFVTELQDHLDDWRFSTLRKSPLLKQWGHKAYAYCDSDRPSCLLPGLYPSVTRSLGQFDRQASFCYLGIPEFENDPLFDEVQPDLLFSFSGQIRNHVSRLPFRRFSHPRGEIIDTSGIYIFEAPPDTVRQLKARYRQQVVRSKFVLCPRGVGCSSYRLFETMAAGRVPVIISDQWVEPAGPDWSTFSIRVRERDVRSIPRLLDDARARYPQMRASCRQAFNDFFSSTSMFNTIGDAIDALHHHHEPRRVVYRARHLMTFSFAGLRETRRRARRTAVRILRTLRLRTPAVNPA